VAIAAPFSVRIPFPAKRCAAAAGDQSLILGILFAQKNLAAILKKDDVFLSFSLSHLWIKKQKFPHPPACGCIAKIDAGGLRLSQAKGQRLGR